MASSFVSTKIVGKAVSPAEVSVVFYHGSSCPDGFAAATVAWLRLGSRAEYRAAEHHSGAAPPDVTGKVAAVVDFCFPKNITEAMIAQTAGKFIVLDHHASAQLELEGVADANKVFEMKQSGATLAWDFFHGGEVPLW
jgi:hypothetical protein